MKISFCLLILSTWTVSILSSATSFCADAGSTAATATPAPTATPVPVVIDWDHLPEGNFKDLLVGKSGLDDATAADFAQQLQQVSLKTHVPGFIILAATMQESDFRPYGVLFDYGNYSCSLAQYNISAWCSTFYKSPRERARIGWPKRISCDEASDLNAQIMAPFVNAILAKHAMPDHGTTVEDFTSLDAAMMTAQMPGKTLGLRKAFYQAAMSFGVNCNTNSDALKVMASSLHDLYRDVIPAELKKYHPAMAWLLADGTYNLGEPAVRLMKLYGGRDIFKRLTPQLYVDTIAQILKSKPPGQDTLTIKLSDGTPSALTYFQICVSQRHIASITNDGLPVDMDPVVKPFTEDCETDFPIKTN